MNYATAGATDAADGHVRELRAAAIEAATGGDHELAAALAGHATQVERRPFLGVGHVVLALRDRSVPVSDFRRHIRRGAAVPVKSGSFDSARWCREANELSASIRSKKPAAAQRAAFLLDMAALRAVIATGGRRAAPAARVEDEVDRAAREGRLFGLPSLRY